MPTLRIFSYLPNPRIAKATIAARLCGVEIELRGAAAQELADWLWDFDAHPLSEAERDAYAHLVHTPKTGFKSGLYKTPAFLQAHPFGTVPAAFGPDGQVGIFESNSIMRAVARLGDADAGLYGRDAYSASRIDSFLDASLVFARDTQVYILTLLEGAMDADLHAKTQRAFTTYLGGIEQALVNGDGYVTATELSLADIAFVAELTLFHNEKNFHALLHNNGLEPILGDTAAAEFPTAHKHFERLSTHPAFAPDIQPYLRELPLR